MSILSIFKPIGDVVTTVIKGKQAESAAKSAAAIVSIKAAAQVKVAGARAANKLADNGQTQEYNLDLVAMQANRATCPRPTQGFAARRPEAAPRSS